jgi:hypothetical protein
LLLHVGEEDVAVRRSVDVDEASPAVERDCTDHLHRAPVAVGLTIDRLLVERRPPVVRRRAEPEARLVDENQLRRVELRLEIESGFTLRLDVRTVERAGDFGLFLYVHHPSPA